MKRALLLAAIAAFFAGCQTRIYAEKKAEVSRPIYSLAQIDGTNTLYISGYAVSSGGWEASARSPIWATEELRGLSIGVQTNGSVTLGLDAYNRDLSTNTISLAHTVITDMATLAEKAIAAYVSAGVSLATAEAKNAVQKAVASYVTKGGSTGKATVTYNNGVLTITDGTTTEVCADGSCSVTQ